MDAASTSVSQDREYIVNGGELTAYLDECRQLVLGEIAEIIPGDSNHTGGLYRIALDYPLRRGKALRPALAIAMCRAHGGLKSSVLRSAAVLELYHNAFLIHDDIEDGSESRRSKETLYREHGMPIAVNVGDGLLALTMGPLLDNMRLIGVGRAIRTLETIARMSRESAEGQMLELSWIRDAAWAPEPRDYVRMVYKKTAWYSFIAPAVVGSIAAGLTDAGIRRACAFTLPLGVVFQIRDDVLNLSESSVGYGKELKGDLYEGKHTLMLIHALRRATPKERSRAEEILQKPRGRPESERNREAVETVIRNAPKGTRKALRKALIQSGVHTPRGNGKTSEDIDFLGHLIDRYDGVGFANRIAARWHAKATASFEALAARLPSSQHVQFLREVVAYTNERNR